jgi:hypothetical protein
LGARTSLPGRPVQSTAKLTLVVAILELELQCPPKTGAPGRICLRYSLNQVAIGQPGDGRLIGR